MAAAGGRSRPPRRRVDGVLLLDKPAGLSSNAALQRAKHLYAAEKAGHTGTLDPLATGLLPLCFGDATKFAQTLLDAPKEYVATVRFGVATTTGDAEGDTRAHVRRGVFAGRARVGIDALRRPDSPDPAGVRGAQIPRPQLLRVRPRRRRHPPRPAADRDCRHRVDRLGRLQSQCCESRRGKGTYIRVLAEDIAAALSSCAHLGALRRTVSGPFSLAGAVTMEALQAMDGPARDSLLLPSDAPLSRRRAARRRRAHGVGPRAGKGRDGAGRSGRHVPLLRSDGTLRRIGRSERRRATVAAARPYRRAVRKSA